MSFMRLPTLSGASSSCALVSAFECAHAAGNNDNGFGLTGTRIAVGTTYCSPTRQFDVGDSKSGTGDIGIANSGSVNIGFFNSGNRNFLVQTDLPFADQAANSAWVTPVSATWVRAIAAWQTWAWESSAS